MALGALRRVSAASLQFAFAALFAVPLTYSGARAEALKEPPVLRSAGGVLDIIMVARPNTKPILGLNDPIGWVYDICRNPGRGATSCAARSFDGSDAYGGTRLALRAGDSLKVRLVNKLPPERNGRKAVQEALCDTYLVTLIGPTCYGIRNKANTWRFNVLHDNVIKCGQSKSAA